MHFQSFVLSTLLSTLTTALPSPDSTLQARACATSYPTGTGNIHLAKNPAFNAYQDLTFSIPTGARGPCSLIYEFPAGYPISSSGNALVDVYALDSTTGAQGSLVGTTTFTSDPNSAKVVTINSFVCKNVMKFRLQLSGTEGAVDFAEAQGAGVVVTYNC